MMGTWREKPLHEKIVSYFQHDKISSLMQTNADLLEELDPESTFESAEEEEDDPLLPPRKKQRRIA